MISTNIEGKLAHMQVVYEPRQETEIDTDASMAHVHWVQQTAEEFVASVSKAQKLLADLHAKIYAPTK